MSVQVYDDDCDDYTTTMMIDEGKSVLGSFDTPFGLLSRSFPGERNARELFAPLYYMYTSVSFSTARCTRFFARAL